MQLTRRPATFVAALAAFGSVASVILLVRLGAFIAQFTGTGATSSLRRDGVLLSIGALGAVNVLFLVWYLTPHLVHRVQPLRPLHSAIAPRTTQAQHERKMQETPTHHLLAARGSLILLYVLPLLALALLVLSLPVSEGLRLGGASLFDLVALLCALGGMSYLVWRWLYVRRAN
ncbi:MAG TPA: hypothetical protein VGP82_03165 [Ktedonobacterales bacterium]|jgi:hypothetical protein|nr:hypothetical protein [Ktedonobacterales bacterium]